MLDHSFKRKKIIKKQNFICRITKNLKEILISMDLQSADRSHKR